MCLFHRAVTWWRGRAQGRWPWCRIDRRGRNGGKSEGGLGVVCIAPVVSLGDGGCPMHLVWRRGIPPVVADVDLPVVFPAIGQHLRQGECRGQRIGLLEIFR
ncbi:MAG: hypothetical protein BWK76_07420 [Desulfobulbaceae bacterium A2]|nr:MAG: hypothetical protein BWK76_07420 [Desulfobulbaceae bacterium A2]